MPPTTTRATYANYYTNSLKDHISILICIYLSGSSCWERIFTKACRVDSNLPFSWLSLGRECWERPKTPLTLQNPSMSHSQNLLSRGGCPRILHSLHSLYKEHAEIASTAPLMLSCLLNPLLTPHSGFSSPLTFTNAAIREQWSTRAMSIHFFGCCCCCCSDIWRQTIRLSS